MLVLIIKKGVFNFNIPTLRRFIIFKFILEILMQIKTNNLTNAYTFINY